MSTDRRRSTGARTLSWAAFAALTGLPVPASAVATERRPERRRRAGSPASRSFPQSLIAPSRRWGGWPVRQPARQAGPTMAELLRPLSAKAVARHRRVMDDDGAAITEWKLPPDEGRMPLLEERQAGRIGDRAWAGLAWFAAATGRPIDAIRQDNESLELSTGGRRAEDSGILQSFLCRDPLTLWPAEAAADQALRIGRRVSRLGPLQSVIERAMAGADMRELAPTGSFAKANLAAAGRLRLLAALEICALLAEEEHGGTTVAGAIATVLADLAKSVRRITATRRMRVANDNNPLRRAA